MVGIHGTLEMRGPSWGILTILSSGQIEFLKEFYTISDMFDKQSLTFDKTVADADEAQESINVKLRCNDMNSTSVIKDCPWSLDHLREDNNVDTHQIKDSVQCCTLH